MCYFLCKITEQKTRKTNQNRYKKHVYFCKGALLLSKYDGEMIRVVVSKLEKSGTTCKAR